MKLTQTLNITKSAKGWHIESIALWEGWERPCYTYDGANTLASALWGGIHLMPEDQTKVELITVKGQTMTNQAAYDIIEKALTGGAYSYSLPHYRSALLGGA
jgi:hypothetical protein